MPPCDLGVAQALVREEQEAAATAAAVATSAASPQPMKTTTTPEANQANQVNQANQANQANFPGDFELSAVNWHSSFLACAVRFSVSHNIFCL